MAETPEQLFSVSDLARLTDFDRGTVAKRLLDAGVEPVKTTQRGKFYPLKEALAALNDPETGDTQLAEAERRKAIANAELQELKLQRERAEVVSVKEVRNHAQALVKGLHQRMAIQFPRDVAALLYKAESAAHITEILQREMGRIFNELRDDHEHFL